jgi:hypothetical protein
MDFFPTVERGMDGVSLPFYLCLNLNLCILLCCYAYKLNILWCFEIDSKHTKNS